MTTLLLKNTTKRISATAIAHYDYLNEPVTLRMGYHVLTERLSFTKVL